MSKHWNRIAGPRSSLRCRPASLYSNLPSSKSYSTTSPKLWLPLKNRIFLSKTSSQTSILLACLCQKNKNFFSTFFFSHAEYIVALPPPLTEGGMMIRRAAYLTFFLTTPTEKGNCQCQTVLTSFYFPREIFWTVLNVFRMKKGNLKNVVYCLPKANVP